MQVAVMRTLGMRLGAACCAAVCILALAACASINTPLPDVPRTPAARAVSQQDRQRAVADLSRAGATHEQDAERQIESSH